jgi:hypothetical protein
MGAALFRARRPIKERDIGSGPRLAVGIEQVVRAYVVLVDGFLDQPHAEHAAIEPQVSRRIR